MSKRKTVFLKLCVKFVLGAGNPGDWWTALESEPSLGSTSQLHVTGLKGPEFALSTMEMDGPFTNVNKGETSLTFNDEWIEGLYVT